MQPEQLTQIMNDPLAQALLNSHIPARLAYTGLDGFPRAIAIGFRWDGTRFVIATATTSPKMQALRAHPQVALTIDTTTFPPHVLLVRGSARVERVAGVAPEYLAATKKYVAPDQWAAFEQQVTALYKEQGRITIVPEWAKLLDFETRLPRAQEELAAKGDDQRENLDRQVNLNQREPGRTDRDPDQDLQDGRRQAESRGEPE